MPQFARTYETQDVMKRTARFIGRQSTPRTGTPSRSQNGTDTVAID
jgi:hypothetical protein